MIFTPNYDRGKPLFGGHPEFAPGTLDFKAPDFVNCTGDADSTLWQGRDQLVFGVNQPVKMWVIEPTTHGARRREHVIHRGDVDHRAEGSAAGGQAALPSGGARRLEGSYAYSRRYRRSESAPATREKTMLGPQPPTAGGRVPA